MHRQGHQSPTTALVIFGDARPEKRPNFEQKYARFYYGEKVVRDVTGPEAGSWSEAKHRPGRKKFPVPRMTGKVV